jgi:beta-lactam-binding protein with PASTA domain
MRAAIAAAGFALVLLAGCGGGASSSPSMPNVTGERLDVAYSDLDAAGVSKGDVEVVGGGTFGVVVESNWVVCEQRPAAGATIERVRLIVDRSCGGAPEPSAGIDAGTGEATEGFTMPDVVGMVLQDAQDLLQSKGSYLMDQVDATGLGRLQILDSNWTVCSQSPPAGASVSPTQIVTLSAVKLTESCP